MTSFTLEEIGRRARTAEEALRVLSASEKNKVLTISADYLVEHRKALLEANEKDVETAKANQMPPALVDRLLLTEERIAQMAEGLRRIAELEDPVGEVLSMKQRPNGLLIVTADAFGLCFKAGNAVVLRGGKDALYSNDAITKILQKALIFCHLPADAILLITDTSHETAEEFMRLNRYIDVLIPRGGAGLIRTVVEQATVPVIETGTGNCHVYVDESADLDMAVEIIFNAKTQRIGVCNACESLVVHEKITDRLLPRLVQKLKEKDVQVRGDEKSRSVCAEIVPALEEDWGKEYLDYIISIKTVKNIDEAIAHINRYNTGHSEAIITRDYENSQKFLDQIDAAAVYVNASTRFTDGFEFGFGGEIGISTQKLHARGPMGLKELTSTKYIIYGNGQVRP